MRRTSVRRVFAAFATGTLVAVATLAVNVAPAHAAATGYILTKGTGSVYTANGIVNLGVIPGGAAKTWFYKIVNTSSTAQQFKVVMAPNSGMSATLYQGSTPRPNTYYTPLVAPGASFLLNIKISVPAGTPQGEKVANLSLRDPETNASLDVAVAVANVTTQTGTKRNDLFLKAGYQPYVGGSFGPQFESSNAIKPGSTATFTLRLQNNGGTPAAIGLSGGQNSFYCPGNFSITVKRGTTNVTTAVLAGTYNTGVLAPGARKELKVLIKLVSATACTSAYYDFTASGADPVVTQYAHVLVGV